MEHKYSTSASGCVFKAQCLSSSMLTSELDVDADTFTTVERFMDRKRLEGSGPTAGK